MNPVEQVARARVVGKSRERRALDPDEVGRLLAAAPAPRALVYRVAVTTGLRRGELAALRADLAAGGIEYDTPAGVADFHSLRTTYAANLCRAGVPLAQAQRLLRHSTRALTANVYTKLRIEDDAGAVARVDVGVSGARGAGEGRRQA